MISDCKGTLQIEAYLMIAWHTSKIVTMFIVQLTDDTKPSLTNANKTLNPSIPFDWDVIFMECSIYQIQEI